MLKFFFVFIVIFSLFSCSSNKEGKETIEKTNINTWTTDSWNVDTKELETKLSNDLDEVLNLVPTE
jgi:hypothetical protein